MTVAELPGLSFFSFPSTPPTKLAWQAGTSPCLTGDTLPETNIAPKNGWLEYYFPIGFRPIFRGELLVSGRVHLHSWLCFQCHSFVFVGLVKRPGTVPNPKNLPKSRSPRRSDLNILLLEGRGLGGFFMEHHINGAKFHKYPWRLYHNWTWFVKFGNQRDVYLGLSPFPGCQWQMKV